jgi:hypothetical protein
MIVVSSADVFGRGIFIFIFTGKQILHFKAYTLNEDNKSNSYILWSVCLWLPIFHFISAFTYTNYISPAVSTGRHDQPLVG